MINSIWIYRMYDIAEEIKLDMVEQILSHVKPAARLRLSRIRPKSIHIKNPPVTMELGAEQITLMGRDYKAVFVSKVYDLGVISITLRIILSDEINYEEYKELAIFLQNDEQIEQYFQDKLKNTGEILEPALVKHSYNGFVEDYIIFYFKQLDRQWDPVPLLLAEDEPVSEQIRREIMQNTFSYGPDDMAIITWDSALVFDASGSTDIPDLLEFANSQLLELRYYDGLLSDKMEKMYDAIEDARSGAGYKKRRHYRDIMNELMELVVDITEITERIENSLKVTEDVFYARVYGAALTIFRTRAWMESIQRKVSIIQQSYTMLSNEVFNQQSTLLELAIVFLFLLEIILALPSYFR